MDYVRKEVVVFKPVVRIYSFVVDCQGPSPDASFVFCGRMSPELPGEHVEDAFTNPPAFCEGGECEVVGVYFSEACK